MRNKKKTIKDQAGKNADALKVLKPKELKPKELKEKEAEPIEYDNHFINGLAEIRKSTKPIDRDEDLTYTFQDNNAPITFNDFEGPMHSFKGIYDGDRTLEDVGEEQIKLSSDLGRINQGPPQYKSFEQLHTTEKVTDLYNSREKIVKMFNAYAKDMSKNIYELK